MPDEEKKKKQKIYLKRKVTDVKKVGGNVSKNVVTGGKGTKTRGGKIIKSKELSYVAPPKKRPKFSKGTTKKVKGSTGIGYKETTESKTARRANRIMKRKGQSLPETTMRASEMKKKYGRRSAKRILKYGAEKDRVVEKKSVTRTGTKGKDYLRGTSKKKKDNPYKNR